MNNKNEDVNNKDKLQTENTNTKNTREKIDNVINKVGSESLNKIGVPKPLADKAIKSGGGKFFPGKSSLTKNFSRNLLAKQINKVTNNNKKETPNDLDEEDLKEQEKEEKKESLGESLKETGKDVAKDIIKKKIWTAILSNPYVLGIIIVVAIILIIVLIIVLLISMDFDFVGIGNINPDYYDFSCNQIYFVWENDDYLKKNNLSSTTNPGMVDISNTERFSYKEYDVNSYVTGIVWTDNKNAGDVNNNTVYELMSVAARSRVTRSISSNCVVLRDYNSENFTELNGTEEKYNEIYSAVNKTGGLIIGKDDAIIDAKYDAFSYTKKTNASYYMMNKNERGEQIIPDSWVEENVNINPLNVFNTTYLESLSLYGAKYLLEKPSSQFDLYRTLKEYYGSDIKYYTINISSGLAIVGTGCMWWPVGSQSTTIENGITYAKDTPETVSISSPFGTRAQPLAGASTNHQAIDINRGVAGNTNIIAAADGTVTKVITGCVEGNTSCGGKLGNAVYIVHGNGLTTRYGHMFSVNVSVGDTVKQGQVIGKMGNTGNSTGTHLDFQIQLNGTPVNPLNYVSAENPRPINCASGGETYTGGSRADFIDYIGKYAVQDMHSSNILASITIAQAALESGWGKSTLASKYNNYFGIKAGGSWNGPTIDLPTTECNSSGCYKTTAIWRVYGNPLASIADHSNLLHNKRYNGVVGEKDYVRAIYIIKNGGYATDPNYVGKIIDIIEENSLSRFDFM